MARRRGRDEDSSASKEAKEERAAGMSGGPRARQEPGSGAAHQSPQGDRRVDNRFEAKGGPRGFEPGHAPSEQGRGTPRPQTLKEHQQGIEPIRGSTAGHGDDTEEIAQRGEPRSEHARHGRQHIPGTRPRE